MQNMTPEELDTARRLTRRMMAKVSFAIICFQSFVTWAYILLASDSDMVAKALIAAWPVLMSGQAVLVSIVLGYLGVSLIERVMMR